MKGQGRDWRERVKGKVGVRGWRERVKKEVGGRVRREKVKGKGVDLAKI